MDGQGKNGRVQTEGKLQQFNPVQLAELGGLPGQRERGTAGA